MGEIKEAIEIYKLNRMAYPEAADATDDLADVIWPMDRRTLPGSMPRRRWSFCNK